MFGSSREVHCNSPEELANLLYMHYKVFRHDGLASSLRNVYDVKVKLAGAPLNPRAAFYKWIVTMPQREWDVLVSKCRDIDAEEMILTGETPIHYGS